MVAVVSFDYFPMTDHLDFGFTETEPWSTAFQWLSYESVNFIENMNSIMLVVWVGFLYILIVGILSFLKQKCGLQCHFKMCKAPCNPTNAWFFIISFIEGTFFELMVCISVSVRSLTLMKYLKRVDYFSIANHFIIFIVVALFVIFVAYFTVFRMPKLQIFYLKELREKNAKILNEARENFRTKQKEKYQSTR